MGSVPLAEESRSLKSSKLCGMRTGQLAPGDSSRDGPFSTASTHSQGGRGDALFSGEVLDHRVAEASGTDQLRIPVADQPSGGCPPEEKAGVPIRHAWGPGSARQIQRKLLASVRLDHRHAGTPCRPAEPKPEPGFRKVRRTQSLQEPSKNFRVNIVGVTGVASTDLCREGAEKKNKAFEMVINGTAFGLDHGTLTYEELGHLAFPGHDPQAMFTVTYRHADAAHGGNGTLVADESVKAKKKGTTFNVRLTTRS